MQYFLLKESNFTEIKILTGQTTLMMAPTAEQSRVQKPFRVKTDNEQVTRSQI